MFVMSERHGTFRRVICPSVQSAAAINGSVAFLEPSI